MREWSEQRPDLESLIQVLVFLAHILNVPYVLVRMTNNCVIFFKGDQRSLD